jgi:hypothetical protein
VQACSLSAAKALSLVIKFIPMTPNFWPTCGYSLLAHNDTGHLVVTDDFLRFLLERPELAPIATSCAAEVALHHSLVEQPRREVTAQELAELQDKDAADNYAVWMRFRQRITTLPTLEASYIALFKGDGVDVPPLLVQHITHILLRHVLGEAPTAMQARAAEMLMHTQKVTVLEDGSVMAADDETVERHATQSGFGSIGELLKQGGIKLRSVDLDVLNDDNQDAYWPRSESYDWVVSVNRGQPALDALCEVMAKWVQHFLGVQVRIQTEREINDDHWVWHVGLDAQASGVLNDLYQGKEVDAERMERLLCLFKLEFVEPNDMLAEVRGKPVYLAMAVDANQRLKLKPQNLLLNLPLAKRS